MFCVSTGNGESEMKMRKNFRSLCVVMTALIMTVCMSAVAFAEQTEWKPSENSEKFEGITYGKGMFSAAAKGTEIVVNSDGTVTLNVTTKPMTSTKYKKVAFSLTELKASDSATMDAIAATIPVTIGTAEDVYVNPFSGENEGIQTFYWSIFSYTMPVEALEKPVYTAGFNVMKKNDDGTYEEGTGKWAYVDTWTINPTEDLISKLRAKQAEVSDADIKERIRLVADYFEGSLLDTVKAYIADAKADLTNLEKIEKALKAYESLNDEQKAEVEADIKILRDAKAAIERKEKEKAEAEAKKKAEQAEIKKVQSTKITGLKVKAGKKKMTVTWKKNAKVFQGYQIQYKIGKKTKTVKITKASTAKKVIKKLKSKKKYTVKVRGYKKVAKVIRYGKWSAAKTVKIK